MARLKSKSRNQGSELQAQNEPVADSVFSFLTVKDAKTDKSAEDSNPETPSIPPATPCSPAYLSPLRGRLLEVASSLRTEFSSLLQDPRVAKDASQYFTRLLGPKRKTGRPKRADVTEALLLEAQGVSRQQIYRRLSKNTRDEQHALREAMRMRKYRQRKRDKLEPVTPT